MPGGDGTGPLGRGPLTGRGAGFCSGFSAPGAMNPVAGYGMGFGRGRGFKNVRRFAGLSAWAGTGFPASGRAYAAQGDDKEILSRQAEFLENQLQWVKSRLEKVGGSAE